MKDVDFELPVTDVDARDMVQLLSRAIPVERWRGSPAGDVDALEQLVCASMMVEDIPEKEMDLNPSVLTPGKVAASSTPAFCYDGR
jgi:hypothetical protein